MRSNSAVRATRAEHSRRFLSWIIYNIYITVSSHPCFGNQGLNNESALGGNGVCLEQWGKTKYYIVIFDQLQGSLWRTNMGSGVMCEGSPYKLHMPKYITRGSNRPWLVLKAAFHSSPSLICTLLYPHQMSSWWSIELLLLYQLTLGLAVEDIYFWSLLHWVIDNLALVKEICLSFLQKRRGPRKVI